MRTFFALPFLILLIGARAPVSAQTVCEVEQLYFWDFETEPADWAGGGFSWCQETGSDTARSGEMYMESFCGGGMSQGTTYSLITPRIYLPNLIAQGQDIYLEYWQKFDFQNGHDFGVVLIETNGSPWDTLIYPFDGSNWNWSTSGALLTPFAGDTIRFQFIAYRGYGAFSHYGLAIEDVGIAVHSFGIESVSNYATCPGECVQLDALVSCGIPPYNYAWLPATGLSDPTSPNPTACPDATTTYILSVTDNANPPNSGVDTMTVTVSPAPQPSLNDTVIFVNQVLCVDPHGIYDSCYWNDSRSESCDTCVTYTEADDYELRLTVYRGQCVVRDTMQITVLADTIVINPDEFWVYPNPAKTVAHIRYELLEPSDVTIDLFTLNGRHVREFTHDDATDGDGRSPGVHVVEWNLTNESGSLIANGVYICRMTATGSVSGETVEVTTKVAVVK